MPFESFFQDLRIGLRVLVKEKGFCALAVTVLALGICAVTTMFAVVNGSLLRGFSFPAAERLVDVQLADPTNFQPNNFNAQITTADFKELDEMGLKSFESLTAYLNGSTVNVTYQGQPRRYQGGYISHDFFATLGVKPALGRDFIPEDDRPGADKAVLLSDALWKSDFGGDPGILGKPIRVNGTAATVVGIMPPKFQFPANEQLWIPVNTSFPPRARNDRNIQTVNIIARLKPGVTLEQAQNEIDVVAKQFAKAYPDTNKQFSLGYVRPLIQSFVGGGFRQTVLTMLAFCVGVLLIACVNVMNMQFARATLRSKELAIRSSLGAGRWRLLRQMLTESLLVASLGALVGVGLAFWATDLIETAGRNVSNPLPAWMTFRIDPVVLAAVVGFTLLAAIVSGLVPAWLSSRANAADVLKESGRGNTGRAINVITQGLVVFQIFVTSILLVVGLLQVQSILRSQTLDYGYDTSGVLGARVGLMEGDYPTSAARQLFYEKLLRELRATPEFESAALTNRFQMMFSGAGPVEIEGKQYAQDSDRTIAQAENVSSDFAATLGQKVIEGRYLTDEDSDQREPVAVVNATFAKKHFGSDSAVGRRFRTTAPDGRNAGPWRRIVGVVTDVRMLGPFNTQNDNAGFYIPFFATAFGPVATEPQALQFGTIVAKPRGGQRGESLIRPVSAVLRKVDPNLPPYFVQTPRTSIESLLSQNRIVAALFGAFGLVAVVLAAVGLFGVQSFAVSRRTQEFGIRMALGAKPGTILGMVFRGGAWQLGLGLAAGLGLMWPLAYKFAPEVSGALFILQIQPWDVPTYLAVALLLGLVSFAAIFVPARRATRVDPMIALRAE
ncbi:ABC transporter permease [Oleiharenicola sp. Vm1]|uniref:ABC transporter permease n=1 Tax=Oleiharenicola sp. Vm1 TaxID=3398393 RepID=UPI0039F61ADA